MKKESLPDFALSNLSGPVSVVAHDAGAANHIAAWLQKTIRSNYIGSFEGPAKKIFSTQCSWLKNFNFRAAVLNSKTLLSGTGWASSYEHDARRLAKNMGFYSIAVIDHWTDYRERFIRLEEEILPDEIWVTDEYAKKIAKAEFPDIPVLKLQNTYLENLKVEIIKKRVFHGPSYELRVLYLFEPIRNEWGVLDRPGEFLAIEYFIDNLKILGLQNSVICLRPHPSDPIGKYESWIKSHPYLNLTNKNFSSLADSIAWADVVVGCQTYAMVVALEVGKKVICSIPAGMPGCKLPHHGIISLAELIGSKL